SASAIAPLVMAHSIRTPLAYTIPPSAIRRFSTILAATTQPSELPRLMPMTTVFRTLLSAHSRLRTIRTTSIPPSVFKHWLSITPAGLIRLWEWGHSATTRLGATTSRWALELAQTLSPPAARFVLEFPVLTSPTAAISATYFRKRLMPTT